MTTPNFEKREIDSIVHDLKTRLRDFDLQASNLRAAQLECSALLGRMEKLQSDIAKADAAVKDGR